MKKNFMMGMFALAALAMTSCSMNDEISSAAKDQEVVFGTYVGRDAQTKAHVEDLAGLKGHGFGVYAYYTGKDKYNYTDNPANFMRDQYVRYSDGQWVYAPVKYWPNNIGDMISFFAYAPYGDTNITPAADNVEGDPYVNFVVNSTVASQVDLLYSSTNNIDKTKPALGETIGFNFAHALSRIGFQVQVQPDLKNDDTTTADDDTQGNGSLAANTVVAVTKVELIGSFYKSGKLNLNGGSWTAVAASKETYALISKDFDNNVATQVLTGEQVLNNKDGYVMIIPKDKSMTQQIKVTYTVTTTDANLEGGNSVITNTITSEEFGIDFLQGKAYTFSLHLGLNSVKFTASVSDWVDGGDIAVNVPMN